MMRARLWKRWLAWAAAGAGVLLCAAWLRCGRLPPGFLEPGKRLSTTVVDRRGELLYESLSGSGDRGFRMEPAELPDTLVSATLAAEDRRFFHHAGLDPLAFSRALWHDLKALAPVEGGSTLTQQAAKRVMERRRSIGGKLLEMLYALRLEHRLTKKEILALYLSVAPYGNQYVGARAASEGYFGCPPENLTPAQAAFLAGLPQRPSALDPYRHFEKAVARQRVVLGRMLALGLLSAEDYRHAVSERLKLVRSRKPFAAPHFVEEVLAKLGDRRALRVETTLDAELQKEVQGILAARRDDLEKHGAHNAAVVVLSNATGEWLAWEGSGNYADVEHGGAIDGVVTPRQPGSALKPFTYALAFERGYTPASLLPDVPASFPTGQAGIVYSPRNYDGVFRGPLKARSALAGSENVPAVWLLSKIGVADLLGLLRRAGFTLFDKTADYYGYGLTLGDAEVRLDEITAAYAAFARGGVFFPAKGVSRIVWAEGPAESRQTGPQRRIVSERTAYWISDVLSDSKARAYVFGTGGSLDFPFKVAAKTGTSQAYRDNWTLGYTRDVTVGVWVGNFDRSELIDSSGITGAAPIFRAVLLAAQRRVTGRLPAEGDPPLASPPPGLVAVRICSLSGMAATEACPSVEVERLPEGLRPAPCLWHVKKGRTVTVAWPAPYRPWARARGLLRDERALPEQAASRKPLRIVNPPQDATYLIDPTLREEYQALSLRAEAEGAPRELKWSVDGKEVGQASSDASCFWPLVRGSHTIAVLDGRGRSDSVRILVK